MKSTAVLLAVAVCFSAPMFAKAQTSEIQNSTYGANVVSRTTRAVKYEHRSGSTKIDFQGTALMPEASGEAKVESKRGYESAAFRAAGEFRPRLPRQREHSFGVHDVPGIRQDASRGDE